MARASIVKFQVEFLSREIPADERVGRLSDWCLRFNHSGLTPQLDGAGRSLGNLSSGSDRMSLRLSSRPRPSRPSKTLRPATLSPYSDPI